MATILEYKCPCCGGVIDFDSKAQKMKCQFCDTEFETEVVEQFNQEIHGATEDGAPEWDEYTSESGSGDWKEGEADSLVSYICTSCGGEIVGDETLSSSKCPWCDSSVIISKNVSGMYRPDYIIPFKIDKEGAKAAMKKFLEKKPLLPDLFKSDARIESIRGIYVPFWLFDCDAEASIRYRATRTHTWSDSNYIYTKTSHFLLRREGSIGFDRVPVDGSEQMDDAYMEAIEPYNYRELEDFTMPYLSGFSANKYDIDAKSSVPRANDRIKNSTQSTFAATTVGYATCYPEHTDIKLKSGDTRYALLPVWVLNTKYEGENYSFCMNGQTGKFVGKLPVDRKKYFKWLFGVAGIAAAVSIAIATLVYFGLWGGAL